MSLDSHRRGSRTVNRTYHHGIGLWAATSRAGAALLAVGVVLCAGCTSGPAGSSATTPAGINTRASGSGTAVPALPARALASPACSTATAASAGLGSVRMAMLSTGESPFGFAATPDGRYGFAAILGGGPAAR